METASRAYGNCWSRIKFPVDIWFSDYIEATNLINENNSKEKLKNSFQSFWIILLCNTLAPQYGIKIEKFSKQPITLIILNVSSKGITWKNLSRRTLNYYHWYYYYFYYNDFFSIVSIDFANCFDNILTQFNVTIFMILLTPHFIFYLPSKDVLVKEFR